MRYLIPSAVICLLTSTLAVAQSASFTVSTGYSNIQIGPHSKLFFERNGAYIDGDVLWRVPDVGFPLLLGVGISGSGYSTDQHISGTFADGSFGFARLFSDLGTFSLEGRAALPVRIGHTGFFVMPQLGAGLLVDSYSIDKLTPAGNFTFIDTDDHVGAAFDLRPGIQAGYSWGWGSAGAEVSYMAAWGDFGRLGSRAQEIRAGVFFRVRF
jgi:hypothetical protein